MTTDVRTFTVGEGDELITYDVRGDLASGRPLFVFGSPMEASYFGTLAGLIHGRPIVTYDPRGTARNPTGTDEITPQRHAEDLHRVIAALDAGPVDCMGTSGGAVNLLALAAAYPDDIHRAVAHEAPIVAYLPDKDIALAVLRDMGETYRREGNGPAMARFIALVMYDGELTADYLDRPAPDPAMFGMSADDDGDRTNPLMRNMPSCNEYEVDVAALAAFGDRFVHAHGAESGEQLASRGGRSVAALLGVESVEFPSNHAGFLPPQPHQPGDPEGWAAKLREVLD
ncbi:MAG TPA: alpha/beta fold hydrolase [Nocardioides sp.]|uniref:alpha/beta fold hydrolase n=1 Tax=uncultured Nocardioides sp. TaxID=198441 RepID=UPI000EBC195F|nr:alpha/beta fold hydrolase [uncultured Nocardioides sp.]HCB04580.1 alpha/beta hydrolase [Nocardioides sp.]HRD63779.1 alpha/beta fold hydrolase [Nocardioides sp.]HRI97924.1 alpha/beta fold hydrolase [Nocardioides sp.]HRK47658.1 alpha/beta fold hydrolase [Nocardioides sp.]